MKCVPNEGMPVYRSPFQKGKLILKFEVRGWGRTGGGSSVPKSPCPNP